MSITLKKKKQSHFFSNYIINLAQPFDNIINVQKCQKPATKPRFITDWSRHFLKLFCTTKFAMIFVAN